MFANQTIFLILLLLLGLLLFFSNKVKEGFSDFDYKIDIKELDDRDFKDNEGGTGIFKDNYASHEILDLHKLKNLKYGKLDKPVPMESTLVKPTKIQELQFLEQLKDISRVTETQFKETKLTSLYPSEINIGINQMREEQPYNVGNLNLPDNTLDVRNNQQQIVNNQERDYRKTTGESKLSQNQKFSKMVKDAEKRFYKNNN